MAFGCQEGRQVYQHVPQGIAVLPHSSSEFLSPFWIGIKTPYVFVIELVQPLGGFDSLGHEYEIEGVHQPPVFI